MYVCENVCMCISVKMYVCVHKFIFSNVEYRVAKTHMMPYFPQKALKLVALLRKMTCSSRYPICMCA